MHKRIHKSIDETVRRVAKKTLRSARKKSAPEPMRIQPQADPLPPRGRPEKSSLANGTEVAPNSICVEVSVLRNFVFVDVC